MRSSPTVLAVACSALALASLAPRHHHIPTLYWNATASVPRGLYVAAPTATPHPGDLVAAWLPLDAKHLAAERHYLPLSVPLIKTVRATQNMTLCASGPTIFLDGITVAERLSRDPSGREMPWWSGCTTLAKGDVFLLAAAHSDSFDGRYFGVTSPSDIISVVRPLWTY